ncbi:MAG TPA: MFS transporter [Solirubrobacteraceae bacterium]
MRGLSACVHRPDLVKLEGMTNLAEIRRVLAHRDFRFLWLAQSASVIGDNIVLVALALFVVELTGSATDLGLVLAAHALSMVSFLLIGGVWADRLPRHRVMIVTDLVRFTLHALLAALIFTGSVHIWQVIVIEVLFGSAEAFFRPASNGLLPQTVPEADIQPATAITTMSNNVAEFAGPALATALVLGAGAGWAFALDAATFLASAAFLTRVRPRHRGHPRAPEAGREVVALGADVTPDRQDAFGEDAAPGADVAPVEPDAFGAPALAPAAARQPRSPTPAPAARESVWEGIRAGAREVRSRVWVWATLASFSLGLFFGVAPWFVLGPLVARQQYGHVSVYGIVEAALGFGTILGSLAGVLWRPRFPIRTGMLLILLWPVTSILYALGLTLALVIPTTIIAGAGVALFDIWWLTALAERIPPAALSRVSSFDWMISLALMPLGYVLAGPLAAGLGAVEVLIAGSALAWVALALGLSSREARTLERLSSSASTPHREELRRGLTHRS